MSKLRVMVARARRRTINTRLLPKHIRGPWAKGNMFASMRAVLGVSAL